MKTSTRFTHEIAEHIDDVKAKPTGRDIEMLAYLCKGTTKVLYHEISCFAAMRFLSGGALKQIVQRMQATPSEILDLQETERPLRSRQRGSFD
jgi:hypothetical protein